MGNPIMPIGKANIAQSLKKKPFEITRYYYKISSSNLTLYLLSVNLFLYRTQVKKLLEVRKERGISQQELSFLTGIEKPYIRRIEKGRTNPTVKTLLKICAALNISLRSLFDFESK